MASTSPLERIQEEIRRKLRELRSKQREQGGDRFQRYLATVHLWSVRRALAVRQLCRNSQMPTLLPGVVATGCLSLATLVSVDLLTGDRWFAVSVMAMVVVTGSLATWWLFGSSRFALEQTAAALGTRLSHLANLDRQIDELKTRDSLLSAQLNQERQSQRAKLQRLLRQPWRQLRGYEFEHFLAEVLTELGHPVNQVGQSGDQGVDLLTVIEGRRVAIQAKGYESSVGNDAVQQAFAGMAFHNCQRCVVITNSRFTASAVALAGRVGCVLVHEHNFDQFVLGELPLA
jgi:HJR/Mrr/RecB family endonuclease